MKSGSAWLKRAAVAAGVAAVAAAGALSSIAQTAPRVEPRAVTPRGPLPDSERAVVELFHNAAPSVAYITTEVLQQAGWFVTASSGRAAAASSWDSAAARRHQQSRRPMAPRKVFVQLDAGDPIAATVVGRAPEYDLAVLKLSRPPTGPPADRSRWAASSELKVGQSVVRDRQPVRPPAALTRGSRQRARIADLPTAGYGAKSRASSRPTRRSTPAIPAGRCSTAPAG